MKLLLYSGYRRTLQKVSGLLILGLLATEGSAQSRETALLPFYPRWVIKWAPLSVVDPDNTFQFGAEYLFARRWAVQQEFGYGNHHFSFMKISVNEQDLRALERKEVWRTRLELRYYLNEFRPQQKLGKYLAAEVLYKRVNWLEQTANWLRDPYGTISIPPNIPITKDVVALHVKGGVQWRLSERLLMDFYTGIGGRMLYVSDVQGRLEGRKMYRFWEFTPSEPGRYSRLSMSLGFKVGYLIYRKRTLPVRK